MSLTSYKSPLCSRAPNVHYQLGGIMCGGLHLPTEFPLESTKFVCFKTTLWQSQSTVKQDAWMKHFKHTFLVKTIPMETNGQWPDKADEWHLLLSQETWQNKVSPLLSPIATSYPCVAEGGCHTSSIPVDHSSVLASAGFRKGSMGPLHKRTSYSQSSQSLNSGNLHWT